MSEGVRVLRCGWWLWLYSCSGVLTAKGHAGILVLGIVLEGSGVKGTSLFYLGVTAG